VLSSEGVREPQPASRPIRYTNTLLFMSFYLYRVLINVSSSGRRHGDVTRGSVRVHATHGRWPRSRSVVRSFRGHLFDRLGVDHLVDPPWGSDRSGCEARRYFGPDSRKTLRSRHDARGIRSVSTAPSVGSDSPRHWSRYRGNGSPQRSCPDTVLTARPGGLRRDEFPDRSTAVFLPSTRSHETATAVTTRSRPTGRTW
jgi:hypothetical protein